MALTGGTRLGSYEVIAAIGAGGMGEVYRARDPRLERNVAIKILPESCAADAERLARFDREAKTLASLNHPHIAQIFGVEDLRGPEGMHLPALVMELVGGPLPTPEALPIAHQIADALETAHERGIIHRDLQPANVKVSPDGVVKVLDFGLAKAISHSDPDVHPANSPTMALTGTQAGLILGTAGYIFDLRSDTGVSYDQAPDGKRLLMIRRAQSASNGSVRMITNWLNELRTVK